MGDNIPDQLPDRYHRLESIRRDQRVEVEGRLIQGCVRCGHPMGGVKGSRDAVCRKCGYKDDCC